MPKAKNTKIWNEDLAKALQARADMARRQGKRSVVTFTEGCQAIVSVRSDIYTFSNGRIVGLPSKKLPKTIDELCRQIIAGNEPIYPPGHVPHEANAAIQGNPYLVDHYCKTIKKRGGAFAILMAFHVSQNKTLTKKQIIQTGQHFCDEEMEENYHAGRTRGAWAGNSQLQKHGLITVQKNVTYNERAGGMRNNGVHTYTLTPNGQLFIEALLELNPMIQQQIESARGREYNMTMGANANPRPTAVMVHNPYIRARSTTPKKASKFSGQDETELRDWARNATIGYQKEFRVGKDRRKRLHDVCDDINRELTGCQLRHESVGGARSRALIITMVESKIIPAASTFVNYDSDDDVQLPVKSSPPRPASRGRLLDESPMKRQAVVPSRQAAALAALERQAFHESIESAKKPAKRALVSPSPKLVQTTEDLPEILAQTCPKARKNLDFTSKSTKQSGPVPSNVVSLLDESSDEEEDRKPPATKPPTSGTIVLSDDDDSILESVLCVTKPKNDLSDGVDSIIIYIDDRERNRNHTPRLLRTELSRLLATGQLSMVWPIKPTATVVERHLRSGDFSFSLVKGGGELPLPVLVERKRIGDLVQRSTKKDHWYQLQTMRRASKVNFILLEGDPRTCTQFIPYGAQEVEVPCPYSHTIDDEDSLYLFMGRAILNDRHGSMMFVQAKDEQSSLRFIGSIGLMAVSCISTEEAQDTTFNSKTAVQAFSKRMRDLGMPYQLAFRLADEFVDIKCLDELYDSIVDVRARDLVLVPIVEDLCDDLNLSGTAQSWSRAIHRAWTATAPEHVCERFQATSHLVEDQALLLSKLYEGLSNEEALDSIFAAQGKDQSLSRRVVIHLPADCVYLFPSPGDRDDAFFRLAPRSDTATQDFPSLSMRTIAGGYSSPPIHIFLLDGKHFVNIVQRKLKHSNDCLIAGRSSAKEIHTGCRLQGDDGRRIMLIRGLGNAVDQAAKTPDFRFETRMVVEMAQAELMLRHRIVILHALRMKEDQEMILRQLALACFRFQLVTDNVQ